MTPDQIRLIQTSFRPVAALGDTAAELFYHRLFQIDPDLRAMFPASGLEAQARKLMAMLTVAVHALAHPEALVPALQSLGRRHAGYGVEPRHYDTVGTALLDTLAAALGEAFDAPTRAAWTAAYTLIAETMQDAAAARAAA
jgi:hemoglobin-like flavoprotein